MHRGMWCAMALAMAAPTYAQSQARGQAAFNPEISLTLQGIAASIQRDPETYEITGFAPTGGEVGPPRRGFSLGESELAIAGNIDPYFRGQLVAALTPPGSYYPRSPTCPRAR